MSRPPLPSPKSSRPSALTNVTATTDTASSPVTAEQTSSPTTRPPLQRHCESSALELPQRAPTEASEATASQERDEETTDSELSDGPQEGRQGQTRDNNASADTPQDKSSPDELEIERLRALQNKLISQRQQQAQMSSPAGRGSPGPRRTQRISPIQEEPPSGISPTLEGAFSSPLPTAQTASTESTESARTIRGSVPPTPVAQPLRTPSYPFPTVPSTPRVWSGSFHQPFTNLSPTVSALYTKDYVAPHDRAASETSTPAASAAAFMPSGATFQAPGAEDPRFPTPSLYDLVLLLGTEPGLPAWWNNVTIIMRDWYGVERATLAIPADPSDIENVPWGQKTTFNLAGSDYGPNIIKDDKDGGPGAFPKASMNLNIPTRAADPYDAPPTTVIPERRPKLPTRHSFAGHEKQKKDSPPDVLTPGFPARPRGPLRTASYVPQSTIRPEHPLRQVSQASFDGASYQQGGPTPSRGQTFSDPEFSSIGGDASSPQLSAVFPVLRALDHEPDALIDNTGINRVLERGRLVTLTRDYSPSLGSTSRKNSTESDEGESARTSIRRSSTAAREAQKPSISRGRNVLASRPGNVDQSDFRLQPLYEEYEQFPSSPWAQSPAPSPAIQNDPNENPFFSTGKVDEETFNPATSNPDYSQFGQVEAIGIDKASTVTHIPLIHPTQSQLMQPLGSDTPSRTPMLSRSASERTVQTASGRDNLQRRAPVAILSILSQTVPYPRNLTDSLKLLGPHLATTFSNAWLFSNAHTQASISQRRFMSGHQVGYAPMSYQENIDELLHIDLENISNSAAGSVTSPSDYSGRSKHSPGGSISGTPGWDPGAMGFSSKHSVTSTPSHASGFEAVESYFDAKKRTTRSSSQSTSASQEPASRKPDKRASKRASVSTVAEREEDVITPQNEKAAAQPVPHDDVAGQTNSPRRPRIPPTLSQHRPHSLLHSYGADFSSSFQSLPAATTPGVRTPAPPTSHARSNSISEVLDMPPPSESLLRTIIDSLPVQIFTALPNTGALTWVNSKFLVYRGQESRQVLEQPWDAIHPEDRDAYLEQWTKSLRTGAQLQQKVRLQRFDGHYRWFYVRVAPLKNKRQQIVHWIGTNMDFHDQHLAELNSARQQETAASEAKYRALANSSPQVVFVVSNRRGLTFCNSQWITYSGQTEAQAHVNGFLEYVHPDDVIKCKLPEMTEDGSPPTNVPTSLPPDHGREDSSSSDMSSETEKTITSSGNSSPETMEMPQAKLSKLASTGILKVTRDGDGRASYTTEVRLRNKNGDYRWHLIRVLLEKSLAEENGEETWYGTATDINDHKLLEQTLKETMDAKTRFLSNMSHEIRTPLNGISGMVNFLLDSPLNPEQLEHVNIIKSSTDSLLNLINDILDLSKVEAGMIKLTMEWLHLPSLIEEVNDLNMGLAIQKGLELNYLVEEGVPSMVKGDKFRIRQVLLNVVGNAIKFTPKGEVFVRCRMNPPDRANPTKENECVIRFEVIDTGKGFNESEAKYLFKRFSQIDASSTRQHGGTGLGLAISMQFVELHGGKMDAISVPDKGSTFFFTIKFGLPTEDDAPKPQSLTPGTPAFEPVTPAGTPLPMDKPILSQMPSATWKDRIASLSSVYGGETVKSPVPSITASEQSKESPSLSSGSSDPSIYTRKSSLRSERSSASSYLPESSALKEMKLALPLKQAGSDEKEKSDDSVDTIRPVAQRSLSPLGSGMQPPMYSILVVCPLEHSREATIRHIKNTLPQAIPHQITSQASLLGAQRMIGGDDPVLFTHIVLVLHESDEVIAIMDQTLSSGAHSTTSIVVVSDPAQKKELMRDAPEYNYGQLALDRRLEFIYRPLKPSKFAIIFDPQKERESSTDRNQDSAQQVVVNQKLVFEELKRRLGDKGHRVLLVEDNQINQTVILKFLGKFSMTTETVLDGVQCTDKVFSKPPGYFSIILCDLHMPNKDGYQACKEIRRWEKKNGHRRHPIIALSANVLGDVYAKCVEAGFNSYVTKPVEFKELSAVMMRFLDPVDPSRPPELMKLRK
ncbi:hypothetical protein BCR34DRAFT_483557 [Clohesyomyces aquaticus]|uniref:histidine kinase n=1 Tax=Clohesyomyces aquaticus TaxID=1231657 RepID=A0A1Y1ZPB7_9PLEO|nr:hypothetical protein BCR34DRAFT_483557 [Clohesyomyces aquaticus]